MRSRYSLPSYFILGDAEVPLEMPQFYDENTYLPFVEFPYDPVVCCPEWYEDHNCLVAFEWVSTKVDPEPYLVSRPHLHEITTPRNPLEAPPAMIFNSRTGKYLFVRLPSALSRQCLCPGADERTDIRIAAVNTKLDDLGVY